MRTLSYFGTYREKDSEMSPKSPPPPAALKSEARTLRSRMAADGSPISQAQALEQTARAHGFRDWNTAQAMARRNGPDTPVMVGQRVQGRYLGQPFVGAVNALADTGQNGQYRVTLHLDAAVDVVEFDSFSNFRQRISAVIGPDGRVPGQAVRRHATSGPDSLGPAPAP